ncbi:unnamed protein product [Amoebophrya sp. A25]|nr:unnamed protein product [Amoebophrya sp. A25]|eukprot:GSA25T00013668001.1
MDRQQPSAAELKLREGMMVVSKQMEHWDMRRLKHKKEYDRRTNRWLSDTCAQVAGSHLAGGETETTKFLRDREERKQAQERAESFLNPGGNKSGAKPMTPADDENGEAAAQTPATKATTPASLPPLVNSSPSSPTAGAGGLLASPSPTGSHVDSTMPFDEHGFPTDWFVREQWVVRQSKSKWKAKTLTQLETLKIGPINLVEKANPQLQVSVNPYSYYETSESKKVIGGDKVPLSKVALSQSRDSTTSYRLQNQKRPQMNSGKTAAFMRGGTKGFIIEPSWEPAKHLETIGTVQLAESQDILGPRYKYRTSFLQPWRLGPQRIRGTQLNADEAALLAAELRAYDVDIEKAAKISSEVRNWASQRSKFETTRFKELRTMMRENPVEENGAEMMDETENQDD